MSAVVCGIDASVPARNAARLGAALAGRIGCELQLVHVGEPATGTTLLADVSARVGAGTATLRVEPGRAADRLAAAGRGAELLVVGRGDGAPWRGRLRGALARSASCPLVVVPPVAALGGRTVVCGVRDLADSGTAALAGALARLLDLPLTLVHVLPLADGPPAPAGVMGRPWEEGEAYALLDGLGGCVATTRVARGATGRELARMAAGERAALLVVGAPRHPASPAAWLLRRTPRPLVVV